MARQNNDNELMEGRKGRKGNTINDGMNDESINQIKSIKKGFVQSIYDVNVTVLVLGSIPAASGAPPANTLAATDNAWLA
jgi:hypothetical protein